VRPRKFAVAYDFWRDLRLAIRSFSATPTVTLVAIVSLSLVIGANTAIFSILNSVLLRSLPVHDPHQLVHVTDSVVRDTGETRVRAWAYPAWAQIRERSHLFQAATAWSFTRFNLASAGETQFVDGIWADGSFFDTLGVRAVLGRTFNVRDDERGGGPDGPVAVVGYNYWLHHFGGDVNVLGKTVRLNNVVFTIVGVTPPEFFGLEVGRTFDFIVPLSTEALVRGRDSALDSASTNFLSIVARLKPGQSLDAAIRELRQAQPEIRQATLGPWSKDVADRYLTSPFTVIPAATGYSNLRRNYGRALLIIAVIVGLVLIVGCVNVANLLLARTIGRRHELSMRLALGASGGRLARQLFAESVLLSTIGTALGVLMAGSLSAFLVRQLSTPTALIFLDVSIDRRVLAFAIGITAATSLLFGTAPALRAARITPIEALKEHGRGSAERGGLMGWLVIVQVAVSVVLVVSAGLFIRSFQSLTNRELGLQPDQVVVVTVDPPAATVDGMQRLALYDRIREAVVALPDVADAATSFLTPAGGGGFTPPVEITSSPASRAPSARADEDVFGNLVSTGWFRTFGTRLIAGRDFAESDRRGSERVAIVNENFARRFLGEGSVLGSTVILYPRTPRALSARIVGVVENAIYTSPKELPPPTWYVPIAQFDLPDFPFASVRLSVRAKTGIAPELLTKSIVAAIAGVNPQVGVTFRPLARQLDSSLMRERLVSELAGFLGVVALVLAALGLYGVTAYSIHRRRNEIGIRMALGATHRRVVALLLTRVSLLVGSGMALGIAMSFWASRVIAGLLYGASPYDPLTLLGSMAVLLTVTGLAAWLPARQAGRIDPARVMRGT